MSLMTRYSRSISSWPRSRTNAATASSIVVGPGDTERFQRSTRRWPINVLKVRSALPFSTTVTSGPTTGNQHSLPNMGQKIVPEIVVHTHPLDSVGARQHLAALAWRNTSVAWPDSASGTE